MHYTSLPAQIFCHNLSLQSYINFSREHLKDAILFFLVQVKRDWTEKLMKSIVCFTNERDLANNYLRIKNKCNYRIIYSCDCIDDCLYHCKKSIERESSFSQLIEKPIKPEPCFCELASKKSKIISVNGPTKNIIITSE